MLFEAGGATLSAGMHLLGVDAAASAEPEGQGPELLAKRRLKPTRKGA